MPLRPLVILLLLLLLFGLIRSLDGGGEEEVRRGFPQEPRERFDSLFLARFAGVSAIDFNGAGVGELVSLGFSPSLAASVVARRDTAGPFRSWSDLYRVKGLHSGLIAVLGPRSGLPRWSDGPRRGKGSYFTPRELFAFDPNTLDSAGFLRLGFSPKGAGMILRYRARGGKFRRVEDFQKLYCVDSLTYATLSEYIRLEAGKRQGPIPYFSPKELFVFNPNTLDSAGFLRLGFSPKGAGMILRYRARGGKFRRVEDFQKLYCVDSLTYATLSGYIRLEEGKRQGPIPYFSPKELFAFDPNTLDSAGFLRLGFSPKGAGMILRYRARGGKFRRVEDFRKLYCVDSATYHTLKSYVVIGW